MRLILVDDGMILLDQQFPASGGGGIVIAPATGLAKDLSSLKLVDNSDLDQRIMKCEDLLSLVARNKVKEASAAGLALVRSSC